MDFTFKFRLNVAVKARQIYIESVNLEKDLRLIDCSLYFLSGFFCMGKEGTTLREETVCGIYFCDLGTQNQRKSKNLFLRFRISKSTKIAEFIFAILLFQKNCGSFIVFRTTYAYSRFLRFHSLCF